MFRPYETPDVQSTPAYLRLRAPVPPPDGRLSRRKYPEPGEAPARSGASPEAACTRSGTCAVRDRSRRHRAVRPPPPATGGTPRPDIQLHIHLPPTPTSSSDPGPVLNVRPHDENPFPLGRFSDLISCARERYSSSDGELDHLGKNTPTPIRPPNQTSGLPRRQDPR